jgi:hypothetical protein
MFEIICSARIAGRGDPANSASPHSVYELMVRLIAEVADAIMIFPNALVLPPDNGLDSRGSSSSSAFSHPLIKTTLRAYIRRYGGFQFLGAFLARRAAVFSCG